MRPQSCRLLQARAFHAQLQKAQVRRSASIEARGRWRALVSLLVPAREVVLAHGEGQALAVKEARFGSAAQIEEAFASGALHPADLKPAVRDAAWGTLSRVRAAVAADKALAAAEKEVAKAAKKNKKK